MEYLVNKVKTYPSFESETNIYYVRISKLLTSQVVINLQRAQKWSKIKKNLKDDELCDIMLEPQNRYESINRQTLALRQNSGSILFTSYNQDTRFYYPPDYRKIPLNEKDPNGPTVESICLLFGGGFPFASAYRIQIGEEKTRVIVINGIHRIYKLAENGYQWCPIVVTDIQSSELPDQLVQVPKSMLLNPHSNPPLIIDFLKKDATIPLSCYNLLKTVRINWNFEQYDTVLK